MRVQDRKSGKSRLNLHGTILEGKSIGLDHPKKKELKRELMFWRTKMQQTKVQSRVQLKDSICFKWVQIGS
jgi:hypothetical protein